MISTTMGYVWGLAAMVGSLIGARMAYGSWPWEAYKTWHCTRDDIARTERRFRLIMLRDFDDGHRSSETIQELLDAGWIERDLRPGEYGSWRLTDLGLAALKVNAWRDRVKPARNKLGANRKVQRDRWNEDNNGAT